MISVGVVGIGPWGYNHLRAFSMISGVRLKVACDLNGALLDRAHRQFPALKTTKDAEIAIAEADALIISSSAKTHFDLARRALLADRHVLVEKPLAMSLDEGHQLVDLAATRKRILMVGHVFLYNPAVALLKKIIDAGEIGRPLYLYSQFLNLGRIRKDENVIWSLAPHDISMANFFLREYPVRVSARGAAYLQEGTEDIGFVNMEYRNQRLAQLHVSWLDPHKVRKVTVVGEEKMAVFDDMAVEEKIKIYDKGAEPVGDGPMFTVRYGEIRAPRVEMKEPLRLEAEHFIECIREGVTPRTDGKQGLEVLRVLDATSRSLAQGGVPVEPAIPLVEAQDDLE